MIRRNPRGLVVVEENVFIGPIVIGAHSNIQDGVVIHFKSGIGPDTDLASLPQVPAAASEFSEDVACTNNALVLGYKAIQNEF